METGQQPTDHEELMQDARRRWGNIAIKHGLRIIGANEHTITVTPIPQSYLISKEVLKSVRDVNWPFEEAARRTQNAHG
jgi:hypothetical protein